MHVHTNTALKFSGRQLPDWGFRQHEVVTDKELNQEDTVWNVEEHRYTRSEWTQAAAHRPLSQQHLLSLMFFSGNESDYRWYLCN